MLIYILIFTIPVIYYLSTGDKGRKNLIFLTYYLTLLSVFVGLGDMLGGYDRYIYAELFDSMADVVREGGNPWTSESFLFYKTEFGYGFLCAILSFVTANRYIFIFIVTVIIYVMIFKSLKDYTEDYPMAVILFMALWFFFTFTYLRQVLAASILWFSVRYIINRDLKRFLLVWFIAYSMHNSAIIFLPTYFIATKKIPFTWVLTGMGAALLIGMTPIPGALFNTYGEVNEARVYNRSGNYAQDMGFRIAYFLESTTFLYLIGLRYKKLLADQRSVVLTNIALLFCFVLLFFVKSENGGRLGWYFMIGVIATLSRTDILKRVEGYRPILLLLCTFLFLRILTSWGGMLAPYKTFLTNGHRTGDIVYEHFEYDSNYDNDKFYR